MRTSTPSRALQPWLLALLFCLPGSILLRTSAALADDADDEDTVIIEADDPAEAAKWFEKGKALAAANRADDARHAFRKALNLHATPQYAANLGTVELAMKRYTDAAKHLDVALAGLDVNVDAARVKAIREARDAAKAEVATLKIVAPAGATLWIEGTPERRIGTAPVEDAVYVNPGHIAVRAQLNSATTTAGADVARGETREIELAFAAPKADVAPAALPAVPKVSADGRTSNGPRLKTVLVVGSSVLMLGGIGTAIGGVFAASGADTSSQSTWAAVTVAGAGVAIAADIALVSIVLLVPEGSSTSNGRVGISALVRPGVSGLRMSGAF